MTTIAYNNGVLYTDTKMTILSDAIGVTQSAETRRKVVEDFLANDADDETKAIFQHHMGCRLWDDREWQMTTKGGKYITPREKIILEGIGEEILAVAFAGAYDFITIFDYYLHHGGLVKDRVFQAITDSVKKFGETMPLHPELFNNHLIVVTKSVAKLYIIDATGIVGTELCYANQPDTALIAGSGAFYHPAADSDSLTGNHYVEFTSPMEISNWVAHAHMDDEMTGEDIVAVNVLNLLK